MSYRDHMTAWCPIPDCSGTVYLDTEHGYGKCDTCKRDDWSDAQWETMIASGDPYYQAEYDEDRYHTHDRGIE